jgi:hypothetical protein
LAIPFDDADGAGNRHRDFEDGQPPALIRFNRCQASSPEDARTTGYDPD